MRKLGLVAIGAAAILAMSSCSTGGNDKAAADSGKITVWVVGSDTPDTARAYLKDTFEAENKGWTLQVEEKTWADVSDTYAAALQSNDAPDVVEIGNTQTASFADQGLIASIEDQRKALGSEDFLPGLEESATYNGELFAAPYYAGGRIVFYSKQILGKTPVPTTLDEYVATGVSTATDKRSGIWAPGRDWYNALPYVWAHGGFIAEQEGDTWKAGFSSDGGVKGLTQLQESTPRLHALPRMATKTARRLRSAPARPSCSPHRRGCSPRSRHRPTQRTPAVPTPTVQTLRPSHFPASRQARPHRSSPAAPTWL